jgi:DNA-binding NtrC family response regulator
LEAAFLRVEVVAVSRLAAGIQQIGETRFDIALLDLNLPDSAGAATFDTFHNAIPDLPVIVLTGSQDVNQTRDVLRRGAQDYLRKSTRMAPLLVRSIANAIERHRLNVKRDGKARQLQDSENRIRKIIEATADAIAIVDLEGIIRFVNPMAAQMFGRASEER